MVNHLVNHLVKCVQPALRGLIFVTERDYVMFGINAVARPYVVCLSSVTFVRPTQPVEILGNVSTPLRSDPLTSTENFTEIVPEELIRQGRGKRNRYSQI